MAWSFRHLFRPRRRPVEAPPPMPAGRDWTRTTVLPLTVAAPPAMVTVTSPRVAASRPLLAPAPTGDPGAAPRGRVTGLVTPGRRPLDGPNPAPVAGPAVAGPLRVVADGPVRTVVDAGPVDQGRPASRRTLPVVTPTVRTAPTVADGALVGPPRSPVGTGPVPPSARDRADGAPWSDPPLDPAAAGPGFVPAAAGPGFVPAVAGYGFDPAGPLAVDGGSAETGRPVPTTRPEPGPASTARPEPDADAARTVAQFAAAGLPTAEVWPPPGFEVAYLAAQATRSAPPARTPAGRVEPPRPDGAPRPAGPGTSHRTDPGDAPPAAAVRPVEVVSAGPRGRRPAAGPPVAGEPAAGLPAAGLPTAAQAPAAAPPSRTDRPAAGQAAVGPATPAPNPPLRTTTSAAAVRAEAAGDLPPPPVRPGAVGPVEPATPAEPPGRAGEKRRPGLTSPSSFLTRRAGTGPPVPADSSPSLAGPVPVDLSPLLAGPVPADALPDPVRTDRPTADEPMPDRAVPSGPVAVPPALPAAAPDPGPDGPAEPSPVATSADVPGRSGAVPVELPPAGPAAAVPSSTAQAPAPPAGATTGPSVVPVPWPVPAPGAGPVPATESRSGAAPAGPAATRYPTATPAPIPSAAGSHRSDPAAPTFPGPTPPASPTRVPPPARPAAVPLVYRAVLPDLPPPVPAPPAGPGVPPVAEVPAPMPAALVDGFRQRYGVDVSAVPVWRGPVATAVAQGSGARAVTRGGEIFLPDSAGPLDAPPARALLAHELAHVVQQRELGGVPAESTGAGRDLEARALAAEHLFGGGAALGIPDPTGTTAPVPLLPAAGANGSHRAGRLPDGPGGTWGVTPGGGLTWHAANGASTAPPAGDGPVQRAPVDTSADALADLRELVRGELTRQEGTGRPPAPDPAPEPATGVDPAPDLVALRAELAAATTVPAIDHGAGRLAELRGTVDRLRAELRTAADRGEAVEARFDRDTELLRSWVRERLPGRAADLDSPDDLEELAGRLYGRLRGRLRQELLVDRERSGRLTRFG
ncbi:eCIS core domain-containing protein [Polymorphospora rubra]|uniref:eCIS core domain-containing protein n=1 Tax=Polymorphospora rubra TaxID=338584 RepID=A0A810MRL0_9ACTN|nr:DUF4157 domain-containing protein [Polymorphospora rubra]BCJ63906.1 hypothetical protein Prubr_09270 [Polymorphospora rubra]